MEIIYRHDGQFIEDHEGRMIPVDIHVTPVGAPGGIEIAHAVAVERNRCLAILDEHLAKLDRVGMHMDAFRVALIREQVAGHDPGEGTRGPGAAPGATEAPIGATDASSAENGPHEPETGMDSCRPSPESEDA